MEEFEKIKIADICTSICSGGTPKSTCQQYYGGEIPWLNTKEINFNRIYKTEKSITEIGLENSSAKWVEKNTVVIAMYGATAGKSAIVKIPLTTSQACCNLMIDPQKADYRFVYYALYNDYLRLASLANGGAQQNLNAQRIKDFDIPYPYIENQKRIANILSSLDDKIELNHRINDNLAVHLLIFVIKKSFIFQAFQLLVKVRQILTVLYKLEFLVFTESFRLCLLIRYCTGMF